MVLGLVLFAAVLIPFVVGLVSFVEEFGRAESVKGYWASLQEFVKQQGRYPKDEAEIGAFFQTVPGKDPVEYVAPHDASSDEVVLWWKQRTLFGVQVGVTESGRIVKK